MQMCGNVSVNDCQRGNHFFLLCEVIEQLACVPLMCQRVSYCNNERCALCIIITSSEPCMHACTHKQAMEIVIFWPPRRQTGCIHLVFLLEQRGTGGRLICNKAQIQRRGEKDERRRDMLEEERGRT